MGPWPADGIAPEGFSREGGRPDAGRRGRVLRRPGPNQSPIKGVSIRARRHRQLPPRPVPRRGTDVRVLRFRCRIRLRQPDQRQQRDLPDGAGCRPAHGRDRPLAASPRTAHPGHRPRRQPEGSVRLRTPHEQPLAQLHGAVVQPGRLRGAVQQRLPSRHPDPQQQRGGRHRLAGRGVQEHHQPVRHSRTPPAGA